MPWRNALMAMAIAESSVRYDVAGNPALSKQRHLGRIDALQAGVIAVGLAANFKPSTFRWA